MNGKRMIDDFIDYLRFEKRYSIHTQVAYRTDLKQFDAFMVHQYECDDWGQVRNVHIRSWIFEMAEEPLEKRSINRKISVLRSFFQFLKREGKLEANPVASIEPIRTHKKLPEVIPEKALHDFLHHEDIGNWKDLRDKILIGLLYEGGLRRAELMALKWKDVDVSSHYLRVTGKRQKQRQIPLRPDFCDELAKFQWAVSSQFVVSKDYVILTDKGQKTYPKWVYNNVRRILSGWAHTVHISPHILRHSIATHLLNGGADIQVIREFLGHSSLAATEIYTHNSIGKLKKAYTEALPDLDEYH